MNAAVIAAWKARRQTLVPAFTGAAAITFLHIATGWARRSNLAPIKRLATTLRDRPDNILAYCKH